VLCRSDARRSCRRLGWLVRGKKFAAARKCGANGLQKKPVITSATTSGSTTTIKAKLNSTPNRTFEILFFSNASGNEGEQFIGQKSVSTNSNGNVTYTFVPSQAVAAGQRITATATNVVEANTSEFSVPRTVVAG
jgi:hypothetical protein